MEQPQSNVTLLPVSRARITEIVRDAHSAGRFSFTACDVGRPGYPNSRQVEMVLRDGQVMEDPVRADEHGCFRFEMFRVCAGTSVVIDVALDGKSPPPNVRVIRVRAEGIED